MVVNVINYNRDVTVFAFLKQKINDIEQENIDLSLQIMDQKQALSVMEQIKQAEDRIAVLKYQMPSEKTQRSPHMINQAFQIDHVKMSKLKAQIAKSISINQNIQMQIDSLEKRIDLMQRGRSYYPTFAETHTPRRNRPKAVNMKPFISHHISLEANVSLR